MDWVLFGALILVAVVGILMWRKVKDQKSILL